jgi:exosortase A-associated hydrolase 2
MVSTNRTLRPIFLRGSAGRIFGIYYPADPGSLASCALVYLPPFAEEMNRARRTVALQARALAALGIPSLVLDPFGTGDSEGNYRDARWHIWLDDISVAAGWLEGESGLAVGLWGLRLGALLAASAAAREPHRFQRLLFWQPVTNGKTMFTQFLRIRVAAALSEGGPRQTTDMLRSELAVAGSVEVAGYEVSAELARALDAQRLENLDPSEGAQIGWFEVGTTAMESVSPASARILDEWRTRKVNIAVTSVIGDQFWAIEELPPAMTLVDATSKLVATWK